MNPNAVYSDLKLFQFPDKIASLPREGAVLPPLHVRIKPVNACNHRCSYCAYLEPHLELGAEMNKKDIIPWPKMQEIIEDLVAMEVKAVTFSGGGEPFLYQHLAECVDRLTAGGVKVASLTNGSRLTGDVARAFAAKATWLRVSIDGWDDESYGKYRNIPSGAFTQLLANMAAFKALGGKCRLGVCMNVDATNAAHIYDLCRKAKEVGVDSFKIAEVVVSNDGVANAKYHQPFAQVVEDQIKRVQDELRSPTYEIYPAYHIMARSFSKTYDWCPFMQINPVIGADLCVYTCHDKAYTTGGRLGSFADLRFRDFWMESKDRFFGIKPSRDCTHHCMAHSKNELAFRYLDLLDEHSAFV